MTLTIRSAAAVVVGDRIRINVERPRVVAGVEDCTIDGLTGVLGEHPDTFTPTTWPGVRFTFDNGQHEDVRVETSVVIG